jgi:HK97 family phage major capsid protein
VLQKAAKKARLDELAVEIKRVTNSPTMSNEQKKAFFETAETEIDDIRAEFKAHEQAQKWSWGAEANMGVSQAAQNTGGYVHLPSPADATPAQWKALTDAMRTGTPFRTEVMPRPSAGMSGSIAMKTYTPALESGITSSFTGTLPAIMSPYAVGMAYDPLDLASLWPAVSMPGPSATQIVHSSNTNEAAIVGEGAVKPELGPGFTVNQIVPSKVAVTVSTSYEALMDTDLYQTGSFASFLPVEAQNSYTNKRWTSC